MADKEMQFLLYQAEEEQISINAIMKDDNIWLTQKAMAELFDVQIPAISKHLKNIFDEGELQEQVVVSKMEITTEHGAIPGKIQHKETKFYNLDAIISVGYRVNSKRATQFRIIYHRADSTKEHMGLTTWKNAPDGRILKSDVTIAKNYLDEKRIKRLERAVTGYFDYIEDLIENEQAFTMEQFAASVNAFLEFRRYKILTDKGSISKARADAKAIKEYNEFNKHQRIDSDFDQAVRKMLGTSTTNFESL